MKERNELQERLHQYYLANRELLLDRAGKAYENNREAKIAYSCEYQKENKAKKALWAKRYRDAHKQEHKKYRQRHKERIALLALARAKVRRATDTNYKLACALRHRLNAALNGGFKRGSAVRELGCTVAELKFYIEGRFKDGMRWDNWGVNGWHIDHNVPLAFFDLTDTDQLQKACHYTNLQPMWAADNIRKGAKQMQ